MFGCQLTVVNKSKLRQTAFPQSTLWSLPVFGNKSDETMEKNFLVYLFALHEDTFRMVLNSISDLPNLKKHNRSDSS